MIPSSHVPGMCQATGNPVKGRKWRVYFLSQYGLQFSGEDPDALSTFLSLHAKQKPNKGIIIASFFLFKKHFSSKSHQEFTDYHGTP